MDADALAATKRMGRKDFEPLMNAYLCGWRSAGLRPGESPLHLERGEGQGEELRFAATTDEHGSRPAGRIQGPQKNAKSARSSLSSLRVASQPSTLNSQPVGHR